MNLNVLINNYILGHPSKEVCDTLAKIRNNPRTIRRATNIAAQDRGFKFESNPYFDEVRAAGINDSDLPTLKDFFRFMDKQEEIEAVEYKKTHRGGLFSSDGVKPVLKNWQAAVAHRGR